MTEAEANKAASEAMGWWEPGQICPHAGSPCLWNGKETHWCHAHNHLAGSELPPPDWMSWETFGRALLELQQRRAWVTFGPEFVEPERPAMTICSIENMRMKSAATAKSADPRIALRGAVIAMGASKEKR